jgi:hypothetical protein
MLIFDPARFVADRIVAAFHYLRRASSKRHVAQMRDLALIACVFLEAGPYAEARSNSGDQLGVYVDWGNPCGRESNVEAFESWLAADSSRSTSSRAIHGPISRHRALDARGARRPRRC